MTIYTSSLPDITIPDVSVTDYVLRNAERLGDKIAFIEGPTGRSMSYRSFEHQVRSLAGGLKARGVGPGTTWAIMSPNIPEYGVVFHGLALAGATVTTLNPTYGPEEIAHQLKDAGASVIVTIGMFEPVAREAAAEVGITEIVVMGPGDGTPLADLFGEPLLEQVPVDLDDHVLVLPYSSGTTGLSKGVMLTHRNLMANLIQKEAHFAVTEHEVVFAVLPFFHIYGMQVLMNYMVRVGTTIVTVPRFDLEEMLRLTQEHKITRLYLVPPIVLAMAKHPHGRRLRPLQRDALVQRGCTAGR